MCVLKRGVERSFQGGSASVAGKRERGGARGELMLKEYGVRIGREGEN